MADETANVEGTAGFLFELGVLKRERRSGWWHTGVRDPESIAEHSFRVAAIGAVLAMMEGADAARVTLMCVMHDTQETRIGDIPHIGRRYLKAASNEEITADQLASAHPAVAAGIQAVVADYENGTDPEVVIAHDADKLECLIQAVEYREQGNMNVQNWIDSSLSALKTTSAKSLAEAALTMSSLAWRQTFLPR
ncbi:HD family hydrolase [Streptomyces sp. NBC_01006]|uniref:HD domain-containing protein n=1 Tax=Streptomyces sp. NBC_01006 TaxID=2903716 RepID=UPI00386866EA|nr:HD domain-containing protein [Streptomyces sp. NBC_01006]